LTLRRLRPEVQEIAAEVVELRRDLHRHPELGFQEVRTAALVADYLRGLGLPVRTGVARTGVVALVEGAQPGPTLLLRADMDALPVHEETGLPFASQEPGKMHACGHDGHTAILLGTARLLADLRPRLKGCVKLVFQPAEEGPGGALPMIEEGVLEDPRVDAAVGLHLWADLPLGRVGLRPGPMMAASDTFDIRIGGRGGHAARPDQALDPIVAAAHLVTALQSLVSRSVDPFESVVVSVTRIHGGEADNVIPTEVRLGGTVRTFREDLRADVRARMERMCRELPAAFGARGEFVFHEGYPAVVNHPQVTRLVEACCREVLAVDGAVEDHRTTGGEDMAYFLQRVPGCYFFLGARPATGHFPHHHPRFDLAEEALPLGVEILVRICQRFLV
jgi:amidohydrolase